MAGTTVSTEPSSLKPQAIQQYFLLRPPPSFPFSVVHFPVFFLTSMAQPFILVYHSTIPFIPLPLSTSQNIHSCCKSISNHWPVTLTLSDATIPIHRHTQSYSNIPFSKMILSQMAIHIHKHNYSCTIIPLSQTILGHIQPFLVHKLQTARAQSLPSSQCMCSIRKL